MVRGRSFICALKQRCVVGRKKGESGLKDKWSLWVQKGSDKVRNECWEWNYEVKVEFKICNYYNKENGPGKSANRNRTVRNGTQQKKLFCCSGGVLNNNLNNAFSPILCTCTHLPSHFQLSRTTSDLRCCYSTYKIQSSVCYHSKKKKVKHYLQVLAFFSFYKYKPAERSRSSAPPNCFPCHNCCRRQTVLVLAEGAGSQSYLFLFLL